MLLRPLSTDFTEARAANSHRIAHLMDNLDVEDNTCHLGPSAQGPSAQEPVRICPYSVGDLDLVERVRGRMVGRGAEPNGAVIHHEQGSV